MERPCECPLAAIGWDRLEAGLLEGEVAGNGAEASDLREESSRHKKSMHRIVEDAAQTLANRIPGGKLRVLGTRNNTSSSRCRRPSPGIDMNLEER